MSKPRKRVTSLDELRRNYNRGMDTTEHTNKSQQSLT